MNFLNFHVNYFPLLFNRRKPSLDRTTFPERNKELFANLISFSKMPDSHNTQIFHDFDR